MAIPPSAKLVFDCFLGGQNCQNDDFKKGDLLFVLSYDKNTIVTQLVVCPVCSSTFIGPQSIFTEGKIFVVNENEKLFNFYVGRALAVLAA